MFVVFEREVENDIKLRWMYSIEIFEDFDGFFLSDDFRGFFYKFT